VENGGNNVYEQMSLLRDLQEIDQEISALEKTRSGYNKEQLDLAEDINKVQEMLDQLNAEISELNGQESQLLLEIEKERDNVAKVESRLPDIQTQKEYVAVLKEIDVAKKANKDLDEQLESKRQEISTLGEDLKEKEEVRSQLQEKLEARGSELTKLLAESEGALQKKIASREKLAVDLPKPLLRKYQQLFKRRNGLALALARNGACLGCNMQLPPQHYNRLLKGSEMLTCPHCNRILYIEKEH
jgi:predicted  nucleic acid-binding Zn-ribbon protein